MYSRDHNDGQQVKSMFHVMQVLWRFTKLYSEPDRNYYISAWSSAELAFSLGYFSRTKKQMSILWCLHKKSLQIAANICTWNSWWGSVCFLAEMLCFLSLDPRSRYLTPAMLMIYILYWNQYFQNRPHMEHLKTLQGCKFTFVCENGYLLAACKTLNLV